MNNAAINPYYGPLEGSDEAIFDKIMNVNVKAPWLLSNLAQAHMKEKGGSIINIASVEGIHPGFRLGLYSMTKAALIMMTKTKQRNGVVMVSDPTQYARDSSRPSLAKAFGPMKN